MTSPPPIPPPVVGLTAMAVQRWLTAGRPAPGPVRKIAAAAIATSGGVIAVQATSGFRRSKTTVDPFHPDRAAALVTSGSFSVTRNPMYVGMALAVLAHGVWRGSPLTLLPAAGFVAWIDRLQIPAEEAALRVNFGEAYDAYCRQVPRWLPGLS